MGWIDLARGRYQCCTPLGFVKDVKCLLSEVCLFNSAVSCKGFVASMGNEGFAGVEYWRNDTDWKTDSLQILCH